MMASMTVVEYELGKHSVLFVDFGVHQGIQRSRDRHCLTDRPGLGAVRNCLAFAVVGVNLEMRRLNPCERIQFEQQPGVTRAHHLVGYEFIFIAEMTRQTQLGALDGIRRWVHAVGDIERMPLLGEMRGDPAAGATVTGLATDAVRKLKLITSLLPADVVAVTIKTLLGGVGVLESKIRSNPLGPVFPQDRVSFRMGILLLPNDELVLRDVGRLERRHRAMAAAALARRYAEVQIPRILRKYLAVCRNRSEKNARNNRYEYAQSPATLTMQSDQHAKSSPTIGC